MYARDENIESVLFTKLKQASESTSLSSLCTEPTHNNSVVQRPVCHVNNQCFCYENKEDCTTCTEENTSEIFELDDSDSEFRLGAGSSDGSSLEIDMNQFESSESFSSIKSEFGVVDGFDQLVKSLKLKSTEIRKSFLQNSEILGKMMTMHGFQSALLDDDLQRLQRKISRVNYEIDEKFEDIMNSFEISKVLIQKCQEEHSRLQKMYLQRLMDEELMKSNVLRIEELTLKFSKFKIEKSPTSPPVMNQPPSTSSELDSEELKKILDDVSTCQSFCLDDW